MMIHHKHEFSDNVVTRMRIVALSEISMATTCAEFMKSHVLKQAFIGSVCMPKRQF